MFIFLIFFGFIKKNAWILLTNIFIIFHWIIVIFVWFDSLHIFFYTGLHTSLLSFIPSLIQSNIAGNSRVRAVFLSNAIFVWFDSLNIFDALRFILHHSRLYFRRFNRTFSVTERYPIISISSLFCIYRDLLKNG